MLMHIEHPGSNLYPLPEHGKIAKIITTSSGKRSTCVSDTGVYMKLSRFIIDRIEDILADWDAFAKTLQHSGKEMSHNDLRDHAKQILQAIAADIDTAENAEQKVKKSQGLVPVAAEGRSAAAAHGTLRHNSGFTLVQVISEFRAIRASVLRLWLLHITHVTEATSNDMVRFNESIDQALAESAITFSDQTSRARETFLAILGHDLRSPLATMTMAGDYLTKPELGTEGTLKIGARVKRSTATMNTMVNDLLEYARTQLGGTMPITPQLSDMKKICQAALDDASAGHPDCAFELDASGELLGYFDGARLQQVFSNLLNNAAQYCAKEHPVAIHVRGELDSVIVQVRNIGPAIPAESLQAIFDSMIQLSTEGRKDRPSTSMGLGLFIAREITVAHGGTITAESSETSGTVFTIRLPRTQVAP